MADSLGAEGYDPSKDPKRKAKSKDPGWKYGFWSELSDKNLVQCILCGKKVHGGIKRLKQHLTGGYGDVAKCPRTTTEISNEMHQAIMSNKRNKPIQFDDSYKVEEIQSSNIPSSASNLSNASSATVPSSGTAAKRMKSGFKFTKSQAQTKTIETYFRKSPEEVVDERHYKGPSQTTLENRLRSPAEKEKEKEKVHMHIANWFYEHDIPFSAANSRSFEVMIEAIGQYGPGLKPPSYHKLRVPRLGKAKTKTEELKEKHKTSWRQHGCTLVSDGWLDRRGLINFLDRAVGAFDAAEGRNLRRPSHVYSRRDGVSTSREPRIKVVDDSDSGAEEEEEGFPNDDEDVDDDYGRRVTIVSSDDTAVGRDDDDLTLDDYA